jgi:hypothetical protein
MGTPPPAGMEEARAYLEELAIRHELPADRTQCLVGRSENAAKEIIATAQANGVGLILMSSAFQSVRVTAQASDPGPRVQ